MNPTEMLRRLVGINSVFPNEKDLGEFIEGYLSANGFAVRRHYVDKNRFNLLAEKGEGTQALLLYSHLDTVPVYGRWETDPLTLTARGDKLYGLGACDMKGGMAAILHAAQQQPRQKLKLLLCVDEENISLGAWRVTTEERAWFDDVVLAISGENGVVDGSVGGTDTVTMGRRGRVVINVDVRGKSVHGALEGGISALEQAAKIALETDHIAMRSQRGMGKEGAFARRITSESTSLSVPDKAILEIDMHLIPGSTTESARKRIEDLISLMQSAGSLSRDAGFSVAVKQRETPYIEPYLTNKNDPLVKKVITMVRRGSGTVRLNFGSSVADDNILANSLHVPVLIIGPAGGNLHSANEWIFGDSLTKLADIYAGIVRSF